MTETSQELKLCWACRKPLGDGQVKCLECSSWQNWRRYMVFSASILSLLIALISVSGALGPSLLEAFRGKSPKIVVIDGKASDLSLTLHIANAGSQITAVMSNIQCIGTYHFRNWQVTEYGQFPSNDYEKAALITYLSADDSIILQPNEKRSIEYSHQATTVLGQPVGHVLVNSLSFKKIHTVDLLAGGVRNDTERTTYSCKIGYYGETNQPIYKQHTSDVLTNSFGLTEFYRAFVKDVPKPGTVSAL
ncbi:MAG: hypothetical protein GY807_13000 [Gammaproteobacteria bacterium]|nr:hypothetical protein [Gammaproteobacteria bacterium]